MSLVTRIGSRASAATEALIPLGKLHSTGPLLAHAGFVPIHSHKVVGTMSQRKRPDNLKPKRL